jgi:hypothetical protein
MTIKRRLATTGKKGAMTIKRRLAMTGKKGATTIRKGGVAAALPAIYQTEVIPLFSFP